MSVVERLPVSTGGRWLTLTGAAGAWAAAYWVNGWLWDVIFYDLLGVAPDGPLTERCTSSSTTSSRSRCC